MSRSDGGQATEVGERAATQTGVGLLVLLMCAAALGGCTLIGYDIQIAAEDAGGGGGGNDSPADAGLDAALQRADGDARVATDSGSVGLSDAVAVGRSDAATDSAVGDSGDSGDSGGRDAAVDAGVPCTNNACGGCSRLAATPNAACGQCGLGHYTCNGTDALLCTGGGTLPSAPGGSVSIDNFDDGDSLPLVSSGIAGHWFMYSDGTAGTLTPPDGSPISTVLDGAGGTTRSAHYVGSGFTSYGAGMILRLNDLFCAYPLTKERGLAFWIKGRSSVIVSVATLQTHDPAYCGTRCDDHYNKTYMLTNLWTRYTVAFSSLKQTGWGTPVAFDASQVQYLQFAFPPNVSFELYLDEVAFY